MQDQNQAPLQIAPETRAFLEGLLQDAQVPFVDEQQKEDLLMDLYTRLDSLLTARIVDNMPGESIEEFIKMNEEGRPQEEIEKFMLEKMPNAKEIFANAFLEFRNLYLGNMAVASNTPQSTDEGEQQGDAS